MDGEVVTSITVITSQRLSSTTAAAGTCFSHRLALSWQVISGSHLSCFTNKKAKIAYSDYFYSRAVNCGESNGRPWPFQNCPSPVLKPPVLSHERMMSFNDEVDGFQVATAGLSSGTQRTLSAPAGASFMLLNSDVFAPETPPMLQMLSYTSPLGSPPMPPPAPRISRPRPEAEVSNISHLQQHEVQYNAHSDLLDSLELAPTSKSLLSVALKRCQVAAEKLPGRSMSSEGRWSGGSSSCSGSQGKVDSGSGNDMDRAPLPALYPFSCPPSLSSSVASVREEAAASRPVVHLPLPSAGISSTPTKAVTATAAVDGSETELPEAPHVIAAGTVDGVNDDEDDAAVTVAVVIQPAFGHDEPAAAAAAATATAAVSAAAVVVPDDVMTGGDHSDPYPVGACPLAVSSCSPVFGWPCTQVGKRGIAIQQAGGSPTLAWLEPAGAEGESGDGATAAAAALSLMMMMPPFDLSHSALWQVGPPRGKPPLPRARHSVPRTVCLLPTHSSDLSSVNTLVSDTSGSCSASASPFPSAADENPEHQNSLRLAHEPIPHASAMPSPQPLCARDLARGVVSPFGSISSMEPEPNNSQSLLDPAAVCWGGANWTRQTSPFAQLAEQQTVLDKGDDGSAADVDHDYNYDHRHISRVDSDGTHGVDTLGTSASVEIGTMSVERLASTRPMPVVAHMSNQVTSPGGASDEDVIAGGLPMADIFSPTMSDEELDDYYVNTLCGGCDPLAAFMQQELARSHELMQVRSQELSSLVIDGEEVEEEVEAEVEDGTEEGIKERDAATLEMGNLLACAEGAEMAEHMPQPLLPRPPVTMLRLDTRAITLSTEYTAAAVGSPELVLSAPFATSPAATAPPNCHLTAAVPLPYPHALSPLSGEASASLLPETTVDFDGDEMFFELKVAEDDREEAVLAEAMTSPPASARGTVPAKVYDPHMMAVEEVKAVAAAVAAVAVADLQEVHHHASLLEPFDSQPQQYHLQSPQPPQQPHLVVVTGACCDFHATQLHSSHELQLRLHLEALQLHGQQNKMNHEESEAEKEADKNEIDFSAGDGGVGNSYWSSSISSPNLEASYGSRELEQWGSADWEELERRPEGDSGGASEGHGLVVTLERVESCAHCSVAAEVRRMVEQVVWSTCFSGVGTAGVMEA